MAPYYTRAYLATDVATADRVALVISLYESALAHVANAKDAVANGDTFERGESIGHAAQILMTLCEALDYTQEGGLAGQLFALYNFQLQQLLEANRRDDIEPLQAVESTLTILLNAWRQVARSPEAERIRSADRTRVAGLPARQSASSNRPALVMSA